MTRSLLATLVCVLCGVPLAAQENVPRIPRQAAPTTGALVVFVQNDQRQGLGGADVAIQDLDRNTKIQVAMPGSNVKGEPLTTGDGVVRANDLQPGRYSVHVTFEGFQPSQTFNLVIRAGELADLTVTLTSTGERQLLRPSIPPPEPQVTYRTIPDELPASPPVPGDQSTPSEPVVAAKSRWLYDFPDYHRYTPLGDAVPNFSVDEAMYKPGWPNYTDGVKNPNKIDKHFFDPFNRNKLKGDFPVFGQTFLNINLISDTFNQVTQLPVPSLLGSQRPQSQYFFGKFTQYDLIQNFEMQLTLFHGDAAFKPVDWQVRVTPDVNLNYIDAQENGIVNPNVLKGDTRLDSHPSLQEAFFEYKIHDLSDNYDFVSIRAGIQIFNSDFRGFIFFTSEPGARIFGNLGSNKYQYNAAYFAMLEKDTNSGLNTFDYRKQQVFVANLYKQDFFFPGFTVQGSYLFNKDDPSLKYNTDNFLVRPSPIGTVYANGQIQRDAIRAHYIGLNTDGHIHRINVESSFYQVLGKDYNNNLAQGSTSSSFLPPRGSSSCATGVQCSPRNINAQMGALELSLDRDWIRYRVSAFYASGAKRPNSHVERGFDSILDNPNFAGGFFSFWIRDGIRLLGSGVGLTQGNSLVPDLRTSKDEGQSNFVNPGIFIYNAATDVKITQKLRGVINVNFVRFAQTQSLVDLLQQGSIHHGVGLDNGIGLVYRPFLSDNMVVMGVINEFLPWRGFEDLLTGRTLFAAAVNVRFRF